ncbi:hypothetical protein GBAR_LOCUS14057 [Geodia barretti]|uniref:Uncharacterized protein n=1 Tax=Geodia barretti TaxID=519541 RepID=A0AA35S7Y1_GEOBA|nr:hypothetical protein GBAR_LOCUS14057 [Geodia barretti]
MVFPLPPVLPPCSCGPGHRWVRGGRCLQPAIFLRAGTTNRQSDEQRAVERRTFSPIDTPPDVMRTSTSSRAFSRQLTKDSRLIDKQEKHHTLYVILRAKCF